MPEHPWETAKRLWEVAGDQRWRLVVASISAIFYVVGTLWAVAYSAGLVDLIWKNIQAAFAAGEVYVVRIGDGGEEILAYLTGNLCRCSGYVGQLRGIRAFLDARDSEGAVGAEGVEDAEGVEGADGLGNVDVASSAQDAPEAALSPKASGVDGAATVPAAMRKAGAEGGSHE